MDNRHVRRILCINYLAGFCPEGSACTDAHPRFELPAPSDIDPKFGKKVISTLSHIYFNMVSNSSTGLSKLNVYF